ncbi:MAG: GNAT family N-acetyltransferase, partial [Ginsengibacter sp.]
MPGQIEIRAILETDDVLIAAIIRTSLVEFGAAKRGTVYFDKTTDHLHEVFKEEKSAYFIAEEQNHILGGA